jgi:D-sedoheptulose 7-phosphate isomerase
MKKNNYKDIIDNAFKEHIDVLKNTNLQISENIEISSDIIAKSLSSEGTIFWCGNGGSAADSQHIAAEFVGRFKKDRIPLRSIALTTDTSVLTCVSNDYSYEEIFSRQLRALGRDGDVLVVISTSGKSENIRQVLIHARKMGIKTIGLLGKEGGDCKDYVDVPLIVPSDITARIQETHILIEHLLCELAEHKLGFN